MSKIQDQNQLTNNRLALENDVYPNRFFTEEGLPIVCYHLKIIVNIISVRLNFQKAMQRKESLCSSTALKRFNEHQTTCSERSQIRLEQKKNVLEKKYQPQRNK